MSKKEIEELAKAERSKYAREWRAKNPERVAAINKRYWEKKAIERLTHEANEKEAN